MESRKEYRILGWIIVVFAAAFFLPIESARFNTAIAATFDLVKWYAREHVVLCLLPAFFIAGVISVFVSQGAVLKYFGANAKKWLAYTVASVSGTILAVCSCTILPLFSSIHKRGAGLGPAIAFLYSGPAINILAIILTARILGFEMGVARTIGAVTFAVVIGSIMAIIYRKEEKVKKEEQMNFEAPPEKRPMWQTSPSLFHAGADPCFCQLGSPFFGRVHRRLVFYLGQQMDYYRLLRTVTGLFPDLHPENQMAMGGGSHRGHGPFRSAGLFADRKCQTGPAGSYDGGHRRVEHHHPARSKRSGKQRMDPFNLGFCQTDLAPAGLWGGDRRLPAGIDA